MPLFDDFLLRAVLAGCAIALAVAPLGCFVIWHRMAYFSDATAHSALLGVALALALQLPVWVGVVIVAIMIAFLVNTITNTMYTSDTILGVLSYSTVSLGLVLLSVLSTRPIDLSYVLFGDILSISKTTLGFTGLAAIGIIAVLLWRWPMWLSLALTPDLAHTHIARARFERGIFTVVLACAITIALNIIGALLIGALLIIPAAAAHPLSRSPESMAVFAALCAVSSVLGGIALSFFVDTPTGPSIIVVCFGLFAVSCGWAWAKQKIRLLGEGEQH